MEAAHVPGPTPAIDLQRATILAILDRLHLAEDAPDAAGLTLILHAGRSPQVFDDVELTLWHDAAAGTLWVRQSGGYPGTAIWFGPGPVELLPSLPSVSTPPVPVQRWGV